MTGLFDTLIEQSLTMIEQSVCISNTEAATCMTLYLYGNVFHKYGTAQVQRHTHV